LLRPILGARHLFGLIEAPDDIGEFFRRDGRRQRSVRAASSTLVVITSAFPRSGWKMPILSSNTTTIRT
jgi:hypothetical protein